MILHNPDSKQHKHYFNFLQFSTTLTWWSKLPTDANFKLFFFSSNFQNKQEVWIQGTCSDCFVDIFFSFYFLAPSQVTIIAIQFMFPNINIFWALVRVVTTLAYQLQLKWLWVPPKTHLNASEHRLYYFVIVINLLAHAVICNTNRHASV